MIQVLFGHAPAALSTGTFYSRLLGVGGTWSATESAVQAPWSAPGVLRNLVI